MNDEKNRNGVSKFRDAVSGSRNTAFESQNPISVGKMSENNYYNM